MSSVVLHVTAAHLPEPERSWLDASKPLPADVRYLRRVPQTYAVILVFLFVPFVLGAVLTVLDLTRGHWKAENTLLVPLFMGPFAWLLWFELRLRKLARALEGGQKRLGLFLGPDSALHALHDDECSVVPRGHVRTPLMLATHTGKHTTYDVGLAFSSADGAPGSLHLDPDEVVFDGGARELLELIERWREKPSRAFEQVQRAPQASASSEPHPDTDRTY